MHSVTRARPMVASQAGNRRVDTGMRQVASGCGFQKASIQIFIME